MRRQREIREQLAVRARSPCLSSSRYSGSDSAAGLLAMCMRSILLHHRTGGSVGRRRDFDSTVPPRTANLTATTLSGRRRERGEGS